jgi:hypothetical protein
MYSSRLTVPACVVGSDASNVAQSAVALTMFCVTVVLNDFAKHWTEVAVVVGSAVVSPVKAAAVKVIVSVTSFASSGRAM